MLAIVITPDFMTAIFLVLAVGVVGLRLKVLENRKSSDKKLINEPFNGDFVSPQKETIYVSRKIDPNNGIF